MLFARYRFFGLGMHVEFFDGPYAGNTVSLDDDNVVSFTVHLMDATGQSVKLSGWIDCEDDPERARDMFQRYAGARAFRLWQSRQDVASDADTSKPPRWRRRRNGPDKWVDSYQIGFDERYRLLEVWRHVLLEPGFRNISTSGWSSSPPQTIIPQSEAAV